MRFKSVKLLRYLRKEIIFTTEGCYVTVPNTAITVCQSYRNCLSCVEGYLCQYGVLVVDLGTFLTSVLLVVPSG